MYILFPLVIATLTGFILGINKKIGFWWVFFFSFFFGWIIGIGMGLASISKKKLQHESTSFQSSGSKLQSLALFIVSILCFYFSYNHITSNLLYLILWILSFGFFGASIYAFRTGNRPYANNEEYQIETQIDGLIVIVITGIQLVCLQIVLTNTPYRHLMNP